MQIIKRDGRVVEFNKERIVNAITKAMMQTPDGIDLDLANKIATSIEKQLENTEQINVYEIQDLVEKKLMGSSRKEVAQSYITYRYNRDIARRSKTQEVFLDIISAKSNEFDKKTNMDIPIIMMMRFASEVIKPYVEAFLLSANVRKVEKEGYIYICDKDYYATKALNSFQYPLNKILENRFEVGKALGAPPKTIEEAINHIYMPMVAIQKEISGGQSIPAFDYFFAPYVKNTYAEEISKQKELGINIDSKYTVEEYIKKDLKGLSEKEKNIQIAINNTVDRVHKAIRTYLHDMNIISMTLDKQISFNTINYGTDTTPEGRCIIREVLNLTYEGIGNNETPIYPIQVWKKKKGVNYSPEDKNYDLYKLALKVTAKRKIPNYINLDASFNENHLWKNEDGQRWYYECAILGDGVRIFENRHGEKTSIGRGNLAQIVVDMPKIAIESALKAQDKLGVNFELGLGSNLTEKYKNTVIQIFKNELENYLEIAATQLYERFKFQGTAIANQFPLLMSGIWKNSKTLDKNDTVEEVIKNGTLNIGFTGLAETLIALIGKHHGESEEAQKLGLEIVILMKDLAEEFSEKYNLNFELIAISKELEERFIRKDRLLYGEIKGVTDLESYTNSIDIPNWYETDIESKIKIEAPYHELCLAGHMLNINFKEEQELEKIINLIDKYNIGYAGISANKS